MAAEYCLLISQAGSMKARRGHLLSPGPPKSLSWGVPMLKLRKASPSVSMSAIAKLSRPHQPSPQPPLVSRLRGETYHKLSNGELSPMQMAVVWRITRSHSPIPMLPSKFWRSNWHSPRTLGQAFPFKAGRRLLPQIIN